MEDILSAYLQHTREPAFWVGGVSMLLLLLVVTKAVGGFMAAWNSCLRFFQPTKAVRLPNAGPSPFRQFLGCVFSFLVLVIVLGLILMIVLFSLFRM